jgi:FlaA1/EpsC-like NDP-sugar epimerase
MIRLFSNLTWRNALIAAHDAVATIFAVLVAFYLRFESNGLLERLPLLWRILPYFILLSIVVCYVFKLTVTKWRFISLPDLFNIVKASTVLALALLVLDYIFIAPNVYGTFFFGKTTIIIYWFLQIFALGGTRVAYRYFRYTRTINQARKQDATPTILIGRAADAEVLFRCWPG